MAFVDLDPGEKKLLLVEEANRWLGVQEVGGNNQGQLVDLFLKNSGLGPGFPWCMAFVEFCIHQVDKIANVLNPNSSVAQMPRGAACLAIWDHSPEEIKSKTPEVGSIVIWQHRGTAQGHTGIVIALPPMLNAFTTIEGNTSADNTAINREGDGVYMKKRMLGSMGTMDLVGFISPWGK